MNKLFVLLLALSPFIAHAAENEENATSPIQQLVEDHTSFTLAVYPPLTKPESNSVFSPFSISNCLSMVYAGARSTTAQEMQQSLSLSFTPQQIAFPTAALNEALLPINAK